MGIFDSPDPTDPTYTPDDIIKLQEMRGRDLWGIDPGKGTGAGLAGLFSGLGSGAYYNNAQDAIRRNQALTAATIKGIGDQTDQGALAKYLMNSGVPAFQAQGAGIYAQNLDPIHQAEQTMKVLQAENMKKFSANPYGDVAPPNAATARVPPSQYAPGPAPQVPAAAAGGAAPTAAPQQGASAPQTPAVTIAAVKNNVLGDPTNATTNWQSLIADPTHGAAIRAYFAKSGEHPANVKQAAEMFVAGAGNAPAAPPAAGPSTAGQPVAQPPASRPAPSEEPEEGATPQPPMTQQQRYAMAALARDKALAQNMLVTQQNPQAAAALLSRVQEAEKSGEYMVPGVGMVRLPGHAENTGYNKLLETTGQKDAEYYDNLHKGLTGSAMIAAQQKQNIGIIKEVLADPAFVSGSLSNIQLGTRRALATLGIDPDSAAATEVFRQTMSRILADQFAGLKSLSSATGEQAGRIFKPMLDIEEASLPNEHDSLEGIRRKIDVLDKAGDLMLRWGTVADQYKMQNGRLDPRFDVALRHEIANTRIPGYDGSGAGAAAKPNAQTITHEQLASIPDGTVLNDPRTGGKVVKQGTQLVPMGPAGSAQNPFTDRAEVTQPGQFVRENGKLLRRTPNMFAERWEEVPEQGRKDH